MPAKPKPVLAQRLRDKLIPPDRARRMLEERAPLGVKIGQYLALLPDVLPPEYCEAFAKLQDAVAAEPFTHVLESIEAELGGPPLSKFAWIEHEPVGAGSLAQVHRALTREGDDVVVKVMRRDIGRRARRQLAEAGSLAGLLEASGLDPGVRPSEVVAEVENWIEQELDFELELRNVSRLHELFGDDPHICVPRPYPALSGKQILTQSFLSGTPLTRILESDSESLVVRTGTSRTLDRALFGKTLMDATLRQVFEAGIFHADLHPGNIKVLGDQSIGYLDYGHVARLEPPLEDGLHRYFRAIHDNDTAEMLQGLLAVLRRDERSDWDGFKRDFLDANSRWLRERDNQGNREHSPTRSYLAATLRAARRNGFSVPASTLAVYRTILAAESIAFRLGAERAIETSGRRVFRRLARRKLGSLFEREALRGDLLQVLDLLRDGPGRLHQLLLDLTEDRFVLRVERSESTEARKRADARAKLVALAVLNVAIAILIGTLGSRPLVGGFNLMSPLIALLIAVLAWMVVLWRRLS